MKEDQRIDQPKGCGLSSHSLTRSYYRAQLSTYKNTTHPVLFLFFHSFPGEVTTPPSTYPDMGIYLPWVVIYRPLVHHPHNSWLLIAFITCIPEYSLFLLTQTFSLLVLLFISLQCSFTCSKYYCQCFIHTNLQPLATPTRLQPAATGTRP